jgi:hypothetical protein
MVYNPLNGNGAAVDRVKRMADLVGDADGLGNALSAKLLCKLW